MKEVADRLNSQISSVTLKKRNYGKSSNGESSKMVVDEANKSLTMSQKSRQRSTSERRDKEEVKKQNVRDLPVIGEKQRYDQHFKNSASTKKPSKICTKLVSSTI